jgi:hypothetical protein
MHKNVEIIPLCRGGQMLNGTSPKIGQNHFNKNIVAKGQNIENKRESLHQNDLF